MPNYPLPARNRGRTPPLSVAATSCLAKQALTANEAASNKAIDIALAALMGGAGMGAITRGIGGMKELSKPPLPEVDAPGQSILRIPVPATAPKEEKPPVSMMSRLGLAKAGSEVADSIRQQVVDPVMQNVGNAMQFDKWWAKPWMPPLTVGSALLGYKGGKGAMNWLIDKQKDRQLEQEVEDSRRDYDKAMSQVYANPKQASTLDEFADHFCKQAESDIAGTAATAKNLLGSSLGIGLLTALGSWHGMHRLTKNYVAGNKDSVALGEAIRRRNRELASSMPAPIVALPDTQ